MSGIAIWLAVISLLVMALGVLIALWSSALDYAREEGGIIGFYLCLWWPRSQSFFSP